MAFKLGVVTDEISADLQLALDTAKGWGIEHVELHSVWGENICHLSDADLSRVLRIIRRSGVTVTNIDSLTLRCALEDDAEYAEHIAHLRRSIEIAPLFGTNVVRLFSFWKKWELDESAWERIFAKMELPIRIAEREGILLGFENVASGNVGTSHDLERLFAAFDSPALKLIWDPGNAAAAGDDRSASDGFLRFRDRIVHIHIKDVDFVNGERRWLPVGAGKVDYVGLLKAVLREGYDGVMAFETHYRPPSGSGIEATKTSLDGFMNALDAAQRE
jgi:sugar phosphate isomerase/epimerase